MGLLGKLFGGTDRNAKLAAWGKTVPLTDLQREVMWELWQAFKSNIIPAQDPLLKLNDEDRKYVLKVCGSSFRPAEFGNADVYRLAIYRDLKSKGYSDLQSFVILGMMFNMVGRKDL